MTSLQFETAWVAPESPDVVWFSGADATRFLNDLISQEIGDLAVGETRRSFLLGPQGKLDFLLWVVKEDERIGLMTDPGRGEALASALGRYRIRVDVEIEPEEGGVWLVVGDWDGADVSWPGVERHLVFGDRPDLAAGSSEVYDGLRIAAGEPVWGVDVDEGTIPHESGLVPASVDFNKGCFLGQELVARIDSRGGNVPRHLRVLDTGSSELQPGSTLIAGGKTVGSVTSATVGTALAMVRREVEVGDTVEVGGITAVVQRPPVPPAA